VDEPLVLRKLFKALVEYRNQLKAEKSLNTRKHHACLLDGLAASLIRLIVQLPASMAPISIVHVSVFQGASAFGKCANDKNDAYEQRLRRRLAETKCSNIPTRPRAQNRVRIGNIELMTEALRE
jgi:hypothetical protein